MDDLISRSALIKYLRDYKWEFAMGSDFSKAMEMIDAQPTAYDVDAVVEQSEHKNGWIEKLLEAKKNCGEDSDCSECPFGQFEDRCILQELQIEKDNGWIPCEKELPTDCDNRFYMCIVENHEEDLPMFCQYDEDYGFGFWHDYYEHTLGFADSEFKTNEELGYEKVIAWQPIPKFSAPYKKGE